MSSSKRAVDVPGISKAGPYSHAVIYGNLVFISGMVGHDPEKDLSFSEQFKNVMEKISKTLQAVGSSLDKVLKVTVYLGDASYFDEMNKIYQQYFPKDQPARTTIVVGFINPKIKVEVDVIAGLS